MRQMLRKNTAGRLQGQCGSHPAADQVSVRWSLVVSWTHFRTHTYFTVSALISDLRKAKTYAGPSGTQLSRSWGVQCLYLEQNTTTWELDLLISQKQAVSYQHLQRIQPNWCLALQSFAVFDVIRSYFCNVTLCSGYQFADRVQTHSNTKRSLSPSELYVTSHPTPLRERNKLYKLHFMQVFVQFIERFS